MSYRYPDWLFEAHVVLQKYEFSLKRTESFAFSFLRMLMIGSIKFVPHGSILAEVLLNPAESSYFILVVVSLQQGPQSVTVHPVLVAQSNGRKEELGRIEILVL